MRRRMIARLDDTAKFRLPELKPFVRYPDFGVTAKLCWAKNCMEERDASTQVLFGARNWRYCLPVAPRDVARAPL